MPTPIDILLDPLSLYILGIYALLIAWEAFMPAKKLPAIPYWKIKGLFSFFVFFYLSSYLPLLYASWLPESQLIDLTRINVGTGALMGMLVYELVW